MAGKTSPGMATMRGNMGRIDGMAICRRHPHAGDGAAESWGTLHLASPHSCQPSITRWSSSCDLHAAIPPKCLRYISRIRGMMRKIGGLNGSNGRLDGHPALGRGEYFVENFPYNQIVQPRRWGCSGHCPGGSNAVAWPFTIDNPARHGAFRDWGDPRGGPGIRAVSFYLPIKGSPPKRPVKSAFSSLDEGGQSWSRVRFPAGPTLTRSRKRSGDPKSILVPSSAKLTGIRFPVSAGYVSINQLAAEGQAIGTIVVGVQRFTVSLVSGPPEWAADTSPLRPGIIQGEETVLTGGFSVTVTPGSSLSSKSNWHGSDWTEPP